MVEIIIQKIILKKNLLEIVKKDYSSDNFDKMPAHFHYFLLLNILNYLVKGGHFFWNF